MGEGAFEQGLGQSVFNQGKEKTFIDKLLARKDVDGLRDLIKKDNWDKATLAEILYLMSGNEQKLLNHSEYSRYFSLKFFVWVKEFATKLEEFYETRTFYEEKEKLSKENKEKKNKEKKNKDDIEDFFLSPIGKRMLGNIIREMEHNLKFLIDLLLRIDRTSLSLNAAAFTEILTNKYEMSYPEQSSLSHQAQQQKQGGVLNLKRG